MTSEAAGAFQELVSEAEGRAASALAFERKQAVLRAAEAAEATRVLEKRWADARKERERTLDMARVAASVLVAGSVDTDSSVPEPGRRSRIFGLARRPHVAGWQLADSHVRVTGGVARENLILAADGSLHSVVAAPQSRRSSKKMHVQEVVEHGRDEEHPKAYFLSNGPLGKEDAYRPDAFYHNPYRRGYEETDKTPELNIRNKLAALVVAHGIDPDAIAMASEPQ